MNDKDRFDLVKNIFKGVNLSTEICYQNACNAVMNSEMLPWQENIILCKLHNEYIRRKLIAEQGKIVVDFTEMLYNFFKNR